MNRQVQQSLIQFAVTAVASLTTLATTTNRLPNEVELYTVFLTSAGAALAIWAGSKMRRRRVGPGAP